MNPPTKAFDLTTFEPRDYQEKLIDAFEDSGLKRFLLVWPRRAGNDVCALALLLRAALRRRGTYFLIYPTFAADRRQSHHA